MVDEAVLADLVKRVEALEARSEILRPDVPPALFFEGRAFSDWKVWSDSETYKYYLSGNAAALVKKSKSDTRFRYEWFIWKDSPGRNASYDFGYGTTELDAKIGAEEALIALQGTAPRVAFSKQLEAVERELARVTKERDALLDMPKRAAAHFLQQRVNAGLDDMLDRLEAENAKLREENALLKFQNAELHDRSGTPL